MTTKLTLPVPDELDAQLKAAASDNKRSKTMEALHRLEQSFVPPLVTYPSYPYTSVNPYVYTAGTTTSPSGESE